MPSVNDFLQFFRDIPQTFAGSVREFKHLSNLVAAAMILAISIVLSYFSIRVSTSLRISFGYLATAMLGMLLGPIMGGVTAGLGDIIKYFIDPSGGAFFPGYTLTAFLGGFIYGIFFYKNKITLTRCILAKTFVNVFLNLVLNTCWSAILTDKAIWVILPPRIWANVGLLPVQILLLYLVLRTVAKILPHINIKYAQLPESTRKRTFP